MSLSQSQRGRQLLLRDLRSERPIRVHEPAQQFRYLRDRAAGTTRRVAAIAVARAGADSSKRAALSHTGMAESDSKSRRNSSSEALSALCGRWAPGRRGAEMGTVWM